MESIIKEVIAPYNPKYNPEFRLDNSNNKLNCFMNSVLQIVWNVRALKESIEIYNQIDTDNQTSVEYRIVDCVLVSNKVFG